MIEIALFALVMLFALAIGAAIPALLELRLTLKTAREELQKGAARAGPLLSEIERTTAALQNIGNAARLASSVGHAVGPAVAAFITTWREARPAEGGPPDPSFDTPNEIRESSRGNGKAANHE